MMIESTERLVTLVMNEGMQQIKCRVWEGTTEQEVKCHVYVIRVAVKEGYPDPVYREFQESLGQHKPATTDIQAIPLRLII